MRELKFRAWAYASKCWVDGLYIGGDGDIASYDEQDYSLSQSLQNIIVEQYTGLKDKNGKEIYEGDIVEDEPGNIWRVEFRAGGFYPFSEPYNNFGCPFGDEVEVIGNIHENQELLEGNNGEEE